MLGRLQRWCLPGLTQWLWLMVFLILLTQPWRTVMVSADGDACFHWRVGEYMLQTGHIIRHEVFSHTRDGAPLISKEWLAEIAFALGARVAGWTMLGGLTGLSVVAALVIATTFALLHRQLIDEGSDRLTASLVTLIAMWAAVTHWLARPHVFSFLLMVLWHGALRRHERTGKLGPLIGSLALLTLLWVNIHGAYLAGFFVLGAYWCGTFLEKNLARLAHLTLAGLICALVSLLNPNGWRLHVHNLAFIRDKFFTNWLAEYLSPNFQSPGTQGFLLWLALLFLVFALARPRLRATETVLLMMWGYFALYAARNVSLFALLTAPLVAPPISAWVRRQWPRACDRLSDIDAGAGGWPVVGALALVGLLQIAGPTALPRDQWPIDALAYVRAHPADFTGNVFNQYKWGGYFLEFAPEHKVFVDGRADFYGDTVVREFDHVTALRAGWPDILAKYHVTWTIMPTDHRLNVALPLLPGWKQVYTDDVATICLKSP